MRARVVSMVGLAALFAPACAGAQCASLPAPPSAPAAERATLTVKGTADVERRPDTAHLAVVVRTRGPALDSTARDHEARVGSAKAVLDRLAASGVTVDEGAFSLNEERAPIPPGGRPSDVPPTYRAETRYELGMPLGTRLDAVVAEVASAGLFELGPVRFSVSDGASAVDDVRRAAVADAKRQAQIYAEGTDMRLDGVDRITDSAAESPGDALVDLPRRVAAPGLPPPSVGIKPPKSLSFSGSVTVVWHIVPR